MIDLIDPTLLFYLQPDLGFHGSVAVHELGQGGVTVEGGEDLGLAGQFGQLSPEGERFTTCPVSLGGFQI